MSVYCKVGEELKSECDKLSYTRRTGQLLLSEISEEHLKLCCKCSLTLET